MICPRCNGQGTVVKATVIEKNLGIYLCDECDATWLDGQTISISNFQDFGEVMNKLGYKGLWSELKDIDEFWDKHR